MQSYEDAVIPMSNVDYLLENKAVENTGLKIFAEDVCNFLDDLSKIILADKESRTYPDLVSFAFWIRKANIQKIKNSYATQSGRIGRGLCFHVAPSNIPINFAFSLAFSLLAGNANIVRLPSASFPQIDIFIKTVRTVIKNYSEIEKRLSFVRYSRTSDATAIFSKIADVRMIWGGDNTIQALKKLETPPRSTDICFADRYSFSLIDAQKIFLLSPEELSKLATEFYNDTYLMDQNACSSPQIIFWLNDSEAARNIFWNAVYDVASKKYVLQDATSVDKYLQFCQDSIEMNNIERFDRAGNLIYRINLNHIDNGIENFRGKGGYFYEYSLKRIEELTTIITDKYQTVTYFGINPEEIRNFIITHNVRGIDRIVPIGKAMEIDIVWDGHDLLIELSREITLK